MVQSRTLLVVAGTTLGFVTSALAGNNDLVADAGARVSYQGGGSYSGNGFNIADASGDNRLTLGGAVQTRFNINSRDDGAVGDQDDLTTGFENSLVRFRASGTVVTRQLGYKVQMTFSGSDGVAAVDDAFGTWDFGNGWQAKWGQFNLPVVREIMIGAEDHLGTDFSVTSMFFGQGYSQGLQFGYTDAMWRAMFAFSDGAGTANTNFDSGAEADYAISARVEGLVVGSDWERFNNYTSWQSTSGDGFLLGGAIHFQDGGETGGTSDTQVFLYTLDGQWEGPGYNITGVLYGANTDTGGGADRSDFGAMLQGGFFFSNQVEGFARYEGFFLDDDFATADNVNFLFGGINYYISQESNAAKFTAQIGYAFDDTSDVFGGPLSGSYNNGFLGQTEDGEVSLQAQMQIVF